MNLSSTCRTCLFNNMDEPVKITETIFKLLEEHKIQQIPRQHQQLELPQSVCFDCYRNLIAFKRFIAQCRDAEEFFKMKLEKLQSNEETVTATNNDDDDVNVTEGAADDIQEEDKMQSLPNVLNGHLENAAEDVKVDYEIETINYMDEKKERPDTDMESKASPSTYDNVVYEHCNSDMEDNDMEYKHRPYDDDEFAEQYLYDNHDDQEAIIVQYEECIELESENKSDETLLILEHEPVFEIEFEQPNADVGSTKPKKKFACQYCEKSFSSRYDLQMHENIHNGIKPFTCDICGKSFRQKNILRTHQTLHYGKTIECEQCGKRFARKSQLILHDRMHRNEKPFVCDYDDCDAAFRERQHLVGHQKMHAGIREHQCEYCSSAFYHRKGLLGHVRAMHSNISYQCDLCERSFNKPYKIRKHLVSAHKIQQADVSQLKRIINTEDDCEEDADDVPAIEMNNLRN